MTTNESFFFRDKVPFEHFRDTIMPALMAARAASRRIRIWCAAAATGQEPYSLAIALKEMGKDLRGWRIEIVATDLSTEVLEKAKSGIYSQFEVQRGLPALMLIKYFSQVGETWQIAPEIRGMVKFMPLNLLNDFSHLGRFDVVLCRNVLIYFDQATKIGVLERIADVTERDGFLVLGGAETVVGLTDRFKPIPDKRGVYGQPAGTWPPEQRRQLQRAAGSRRSRRRPGADARLSLAGWHRRGHAPRCWRSRRPNRPGCRSASASNR